MIKPRVPETDHGIQGKDIVAVYDQMQRYQRDHGWIPTRTLLENGIVSGQALEIGFGPGYLGLDWLKATQGTSLVGVDISPDMVVLADKNAREYGLESRAHYQLGKGDQIPFPEATFDVVFTNGSLHEWTNPEKTFTEIERVLRPGGNYLIADLRRNLSFFSKYFLWLNTRPASIRPYLISSINAAYTVKELEGMLLSTELRGAKVEESLMDLQIIGVKS